MSRSHRFVIFGTYDDVVTLDSGMMREGDMIGTEVSLADDMEKKAEERSGLLQVKVFLEKVQLPLK